MTSQKIREQLDEIRETIGELMEGLNGKEGTVRNLEEVIRYGGIRNSIYRMPFCKAAKLLTYDSSFFKVGDIIINHHEKYGDVPWDVIDVDRDRPKDYTGPSITLMTHCVLPDEVQFSARTPIYPYGQNNYEGSEIRNYLNGRLLEGFDRQDREAMAAVPRDTYDPETCEYYTISDRLFLPSASELDYRGDIIMDEGEPYQLFAVEDGSEHRIKTVLGKNDSVWYWMRSATPSYAYAVRYVLSSTGALGNSIACGGRCVAPACVIIGA